MAISFTNTRLDRSPEQNHLDDHEAIAENSGNAMSTWMPIVDLDLVALLELGLRNGIAEDPTELAIATTNYLSILDLAIPHLSDLALFGSHEIDDTLDPHETKCVALCMHEQVIAVQGDEKVGSVATASVDMLLAEEEHW